MMTKLIILRSLATALVFCTWLSPALHAHLLPAQRGTLNFVDNGAFMALSLPISAFTGVDDNKNGSVSMLEFNKHRAKILTRVKGAISLSEKGANQFLQGIMLSPVPEDEHSTESDPDISRVYVMGKFVLGPEYSHLSFRNDIYGAQPSEQRFKITATRLSSQQKQIFELSPNRTSVAIFNDEEKQISKVAD